MTQNDLADYLRQVGNAGDGPHDIARVALMLAAFDHPNNDLTSYEEHLSEIAEATQKECSLSNYVEDSARAMVALMTGRFGYDGDRISYDNPQNADMISVVDRRRGLPVALGILYLHAARAAGFDATGLNAPNHFLLSISLRGQGVLIDPFNGGAATDKERLDAPPAMLAALHENPQTSQTVSDIDVLLRLQNNIKMRALQLGDQTRALEIAGRMALIAPRKAELWIDLARLNESLGALGAARQAYETCLTLENGAQGLHNEAALSLLALKRRLN